MNESLFGYRSVINIFLYTFLKMKLALKQKFISEISLFREGKGSREVWRILEL